MSLWVLARLTHTSVVSWWVTWEPLGLGWPWLDDLALLRVDLNFFSWQRQGSKRTSGSMHILLRPRLRRHTVTPFTFCWPSKLKGQPGYKGWGEGLHLLMKAAAESHCQRHGFREGWRIKMFLQSTTLRFLPALKSLKSNSSWIRVKEGCWIPIVSGQG